MKKFVFGLSIASALLAAVPGSAQEIHAFVAEGRLHVLEPATGQSERVALAVAPEVVFGSHRGQILLGAEARVLPADSDAWGGTNLWLVGPDGRGARRVTTGQSVLRATTSEATGLTAYWTRDMKVFVAELGGKAPRLVSDRGAAPAFSPDGRQLAYAAIPAYLPAGGLPGELELHVFDLATGTDRALTVGYDDSEPFWSPDGREVFFLSGLRTGVTSLWKIAAEGGEPEQQTNFGVVSALEEGFVPNPSANSDVRWSPDGSMITYGARYREAGEVVVIELDGARRSVGARVLGTGRFPAWSDHGTVVVPEIGGEAVELSPWGGEGIPAVDLVDARVNAVETSGLEIDLGNLFKSASCSAERFRWPVASHPTGTHYYYDNNNTVGVRRSWKLVSGVCDTAQTYDQHRGTDIPVVCGTAVYAGASGTVSTRNDGCADIGSLGSTCGGGFGNYVKIDHGNSWFSIYAHLKNGTPRALGAVTCGNQVGQSCSSGNSSGAHLHFEVQKYAVPGNDPFSGTCSGTESFWCNQNGDGTGKPSRTCCCS